MSKSPEKAAPISIGSSNLLWYFSIKGRPARPVLSLEYCLHWTDKLPFRATCAFGASTVFIYVLALLSYFGFACTTKVNIHALGLHVSLLPLTQDLYLIVTQSNTPSCCYQHTFCASDVCCISSQLKTVTDKCASFSFLSSSC